MALEELLDDLVWARKMLIQFDSQSILPQRLERHFIEIARDRDLGLNVRIETWELAREILFSVEEMEKLQILRREPGTRKKHLYAGYPARYLPPASLNGGERKLDSRKCKQFLEFLGSCGLDENQALCLERISNSEWGMPYPLKECREDLRKAHAILCDMVRGDIRDKGVIIQLCPTSNLVIGGLRSYTDHPLFDYDSYGLDKGILSQHG